jgi:hypothetical protein
MAAVPAIRTRPRETPVFPRESGFSPRSGGAPPSIRCQAAASFRMIASARHCNCFPAPDEASWALAVIARVRKIQQISRFMRETIGQEGPFHNKQIAGRPGIRGSPPCMSSILQRVAPIGEARDREILKDAATYVSIRNGRRARSRPTCSLPEKPSAAPRGRWWCFSTAASGTRPRPPSSSPTACTSPAAARWRWPRRPAPRRAPRHRPVEAIEDARDLIRWLRHNADTFNSIPTRW